MVAVEREMAHGGVVPGLETEGVCWAGPTGGWSTSWGFPGGRRQEDPTMKSKVIAGCVALGAAAWLAGCGDENMSSAPATKPAAAPPAPAAPAAPPTPAAPAPVEAAKPAVPAEAPKAAEAAKTQVQDAANAVKAAAAGAAVQKQLTDLAAEVKGLIAEGKGTEALQRLTDGLKGLKLNPDQQKFVDGLKQQAQEAGEEGCRVGDQSGRRPAEAQGEELTGGRGTIPAGLAANHAKRNETRRASGGCRWRADFFAVERASAVGAAVRRVRRRRWDRRGREVRRCYRRTCRRVRRSG